MVCSTFECNGNSLELNPSPTTHDYGFSLKAICAILDGLCDTNSLGKTDNLKKLCVRHIEGEKKSLSDSGSK